MEEREDVLEGESNRLCLEEVGVVGLGGELIHPVGDRRATFVRVDGVRDSHPVGVAGIILRGGVEFSGSNSRGREIVGRCGLGGSSSFWREERMESPLLSFLVRVRANGIV